MTVAAGTVNKVAYTGTTATSCPVPFVFYATSDLKVYKTDLAGVDTLLTITTNYTVSGGNGAIGTVTLLAAPLTTDTITIVRELPLEQGLDLANNDPFDADDVEEALDKTTYRLIQLKEQVDRALAYSVTTPDAEVQSATDYLTTLDTKVATATAAQGAAEVAQGAAEAAQGLAEDARDAAAASAASVDATNLCQINATKVFSKPQHITAKALTPGSSVAVDLADSSVFSLTPDQAFTVADPSHKPASGDWQPVTFLITSGGDYAGSWNAYWDFGGTGAPTLSTDSGKIDAISFICGATKAIFTGLSQAAG